MGKNKEEFTGLRLHLHETSDEAVAIDALVDDLLHDNFDGALHDLHTPYTEGGHYGEKAEESPGNS